MRKLVTFIIAILLPLLSFGQIFNPSNATVCKGGNTSFTSGSIYPAPTYQWQFKHKGTWYDLVNSAPFSGVTSTTLTLTSVSDTLNNDSFKCKVYFNSNLVGISKAAKLTVLGNSTPPSSVSATVNPVDCPGGSTQLTLTGGSLNTGSSWKWYAGSCGKNAVSVNVNPDSTTTYYVRAEGSCGDTTACLSVTVVVSGKNSVAPQSVSASRDTVCSGDSTTLSVVGGSLGTGAKWKWYSGGSCSVVLDTQGVSSITVSPVTTTVYSVKAVGKCNSTACKSITVVANPLPSVSAGIDTAVCRFSSIVLNPSVSGLNTYHWSPATGLNDTTIRNPVANPLVTTFYVLTVTNAKNCVKSDTVNVKVHDLPPVLAGNDTTICEGGKAQLSANGGTAYAWSPATGLDDPNISNPVSIATVAVKYTVRVTDQYQCSDTASVNISVNPAPKINISGDTAICKGNSVVLHSEDGAIYDWSPALGLDNKSISDPKATPGASTTYSVKVTNTFGCSASDSSVISVKPLPDVNAGLDVAICTGDLVQLNTTEGNGYTYTWNPVTSLADPGSRTPSATPDTTTNYTVTVNLNGCIKSDTVKVIVRNGPKSDFILVDTIVCRNTYWSRYCVTPSTHDFKWTVMNGNIMSGQGTSCIEVHWSETAANGTVAIKDSLKVSPHCLVSRSVNVTISGSVAPQPSVIKAKGPAILVCPNSPFTFHEWGFENKVSRVEQNKCSGDTLCNYGTIDTVNFYYWVRAGDDKTCLTKSYYNRSNNIIVIPSIESIPFVLVYPNPVTDKLIIESSSAISSIVVKNMVGQSVVNMPAIENNHQWMLDVSTLAKGVYFLSIQINDSRITRKIIVQ